MPQEKKFSMKMPTYPSNAEAERSVLASLLLDKSVAIKTLTSLNEEDFFEPRHKLILQAMKALDADGIELDFVSLVEKLQRASLLEEAGGIGYIGELSNYIASAAACRQHVAILKKLSLLRGLLNASKDIAEDVYTSDDAAASLEHAQNVILDLAMGRVDSTLVHIGSVVNEVVHNYEVLSSSETRVTGLLTGYNNLDQAMNGLQKSDLIVLAARPGVGKTAFALSIACNIARRPEYKDKKVLVFSLEMDDKQLAQRMLCNVGQVNATKLRQVELDTGDFVRFHKAMDVLAGSQIYLDQTAETNPEQIFAKCKQFVLEKGGVDLIIIDYLQLMESGQKQHAGNRQGEVAYISRRIKLLAKQLNVPIILLSQLSRGVEINGEKPQLHHLRDSGAIEQDADIVMFLHKAPNQPVEETYIECIIAKYRAGEPGSHAFRWDGSTFTFTPANPKILDHLPQKDQPSDTPPDQASANPEVKRVPATPVYGDTVPNVGMSRQEVEQVPFDAGQLDPPPADPYKDFLKETEDKR